MASHMEFKVKFQLKRSVKEERYERCKKNVFIVLNWVAMGIILCFSFFTGVGQTNLSSWNMTLYCGSDKFNQKLTPISEKWAVISTFMLTVILIAIMTVRMVILNKVTKDFLNIVNFLAGFLLSWDIVFVLQNIFSYPIPSFYQNEKLSQFYNCTNSSSQIASTKLHQLDFDSRGSFPSFVMCAASYTTAYFFLFITYLDTAKAFAAKILFLVVPGFICCTYGVQLWQTHNNHLEDIICGTVIGISLASFIMKDLIRSKRDFENFKEDFVSVLITREGELVESDQSEGGDADDGSSNYNQYTINLYPHASSVSEAPVISEISDEPPPYSSI